MGGGTILLAGAIGLALIGLIRLVLWVERDFDPAIEEEFGPEPPDAHLTRWRDEGLL